jgi:hypothetical protein
MSLDTQSTVIGDWLKGEIEIPQLYSRDAITLLAGSGDLVTGTVLGKITASGKYVPLDPDVSPSDGSEVAAGILLLDRDVDASSDDTGAVAIVRNATVADSGLTWPTGISAGNKTTAIAQLAALGIIEREEA